MTLHAATSLELPYIPSPPLCPFVPNDEQRRFLTLHARHFVVKWQWLMRETQLRATTDRGVTATISAAALDELVRSGLVFRGVSVCDVMLSELGMEMCK